MTVTLRPGNVSVTAIAARRPAPPPPTTRTSQEKVSIAMRDSAFWGSAVRGSVPGSMFCVRAKAERYRLLNEPGEAESICLDALEADPDNQEALVTLLLALTEQFDDDPANAVLGARNCTQRIRDDYERAYFTGLIWERRAKA